MEYEKWKTGGFSNLTVLKEWRAVGKTSTEKNISHENRMVINSATDNISSHKQEKGELVWGGTVNKSGPRRF